MQKSDTTRFASGIKTPNTEGAGPKGGRPVILPDEILAPAPCASPGGRVVMGGPRQGPAQAQSDGREPRGGASRVPSTEQAAPVGGSVLTPYTRRELPPPEHLLRAGP